MLFCPKCKQFVRKVVFGIACGCTVLTGHAEEKFPKKWTSETAQQVRVEVSSSTATAQSTISGLVDWPEIKKLRGPS